SNIASNMAASNTTASNMASTSNIASTSNVASISTAASILLTQKNKYKTFLNLQFMILAKEKLNAIYAQIKKTASSEDFMIVASQSSEYILREALIK
ncbi:20916_t:CDS:2, partial [Racocetra persica]